MAAAEEEAAARGAHGVIPDPEGDIPPMDPQGRSSSGKGAREEEGQCRHARGKRSRVDQQGSVGATGALQPTSPGPEPTLTDWGSESPLPWRYARRPARRLQWMVLGWRAGEVAELVRCVKWAERTRRGREKHGSHPFRDLVHRTVRQQDKGPGMAEDTWRRMLGEALPGMDLKGPRERGRMPRVRMLRELLQREGWY